MSVDRGVRLVAFPGRMDGVFFRNELPYLKEEFSEVVVFTYPGNEEEYKDLAQTYGLKYYVVPTFGVAALFRSLPKLFLDETVRSEARGRSLKQLAYMLLYLVWADIVEQTYRDELVSDKPTVLYSFWLSRGAYAACNLKAKFGLKKAVSRAHGYDLYEGRNIANYLPFRRLLSDTLDEIHFISVDGMKYFKERWGGGSASTMVSHLGTHPFGYVKKMRSKETICIASCSAIVDVKRLDLIVDVLEKADISVFWLHIGDGDKREEIEEYASSKLQPKSFEFLGHIDNVKLASVYEKYDVDFFINLSDSEGIPVSIMEAMSMGIPAIARNVGGNGEIVCDASGGLLLDRVDERAVYAYLRQRFNPDAYEWLSNRARKAWMSSFLAQDCYPRFFEQLSR